MRENATSGFEAAVSERQIVQEPLDPGSQCVY